MSEECEVDLSEKVLRGLIWLADELRAVKVGEPQCAERIQGFLSQSFTLAEPLALEVLRLRERVRDMELMLRAAWPENRCIEPDPERKCWHLFDANEGPFSMDIPCDGTGLPLLTDKDRRILGEKET